MRSSANAGPISNGFPAKSSLIEHFLSFLRRVTPMRDTTAPAMTPLKLIALDEEDLAILSSHLQDAVVRVEDIAYLPGQKRLAAVLNRFDWEKATVEGGEAYQRRRTALRFDRVLGAKLKNIKLTARDRILSLLAVSFEPGEAPSGKVTLFFSGDASIP